MEIKNYNIYIYHHYNPISSLKLNKIHGSIKIFAVINIII